MKKTLGKDGPALFLHQVELGPMQNFIYLIGCEKTREAAVVDPAWDVQAILTIARNHQFQIKTILLTHCHIDHIGSAPFFKKQYGTKILIHELDAKDPTIPTEWASDEP